MRDEGAGEFLVVRRDQVDERRRITEGTAVAQFAGSVDGGAELVIHFPVGAALFSRQVALAVGAIPGTQASHRIEGLECEAGRIDLRMASGAVRVSAVLVQLFANRRRPAGVRINGGDTGRRRRGGRVKEAVGDPDAAFDGRGGGAVGGQLMDGSLAEQATAEAFGRQGDFAYFHACDTGDAVVFGESLGEHREAGLHQGTSGEIFRNQLADEGWGFAGDALSE